MLGMLGGSLDRDEWAVKVSCQSSLASFLEGIPMLCRLLGRTLDRFALVSEATF